MNLTAKCNRCNRKHRGGICRKCRCPEFRIIGPAHVVNQLNPKRGQKPLFT